MEGRAPAHEKKIVTVSSLWAHHELTVTTVVTAPGPMITSQSRLGEVTVQSRLGHSSVTVRSQLNHGIFSMITAQSRLGHSSITAQVTAQSRLAVTILVTVSSQWAHGELTVWQSRWPIFFSWVIAVQDCGPLVLGTGPTDQMLDFSCTHMIIYSIWLNDSNLRLSVIILGMVPAKLRDGFNLSLQLEIVLQSKLPLIGWVHAQNDPLSLSINRGEWVHLWRDCKNNTFLWSLHLMNSIVDLLTISTNGPVSFDSCQLFSDGH